MLPVKYMYNISLSVSQIGLWTWMGEEQEDTPVQSHSLVSYWWKNSQSRVRANDLSKGVWCDRLRGVPWKRVSVEDLSEI